jgi:hypothetical protein
MCCVRGRWGRVSPVSRLQSQFEEFVMSSVILRCTSPQTYSLLPHQGMTALLPIKLSTSVAGDLGGVTDTVQQPLDMVHV